MSEDAAALRGLVDIRFPPLTPAQEGADMLLALGLGILLALLLALIARLVTVPRIRRAKPFSARLAQARHLPERERLLALARLSREAGDLPDALARDLREALYRPGASLDLPALERAIAAASSRGRG